MKRDAVNYFSVGLFVLAALGLMLFALYRIISAGGERDTYYTDYRNVAGISAGTLVTYEGYVLGHVSVIEPHRTPEGLEYRVEMKVRKGWQIPADSVAWIRSQGLLADTVVDISEGRSQTFLTPGAAMKGEQGVDLVASMGELAGEFGDLSRHQLRPLLENLNRTATRVGGQLVTRLPAMFDEVDRLVAKLDDSATHLSGMLNADTETQALRVLNNMDHAAADFRTLTAGLLEVRREAQELIGKLDQLVTENRPDLRQAVGDLRRVLRQVSRYSDAILQNADNASRNMSEFTRQIRENPGRLLGGQVPVDRRSSRD